MSTWLWVGGAAFLSCGLGFLVGCVLAASAGHAYCRRERRALNEYIDYLEGGGDVVAEAEDLLREPGS